VRKVRPARRSVAQPRAAALLLAALFGLLVGVATPRPARAQAPDEAARHIIEEARQASGGAAWDRIEGWVEQGTLQAGGLAGRYQTWLDFPHLRSLTTFTLGPSSGSQGWDGRQAWSTDSAREVRIERGGEAVASAIGDAYLSTFAWYFPDRWPATLHFEGERRDGALLYDVVRVAPKGADPFALWFDHTSHRLARAVQLSGPMPATFLFLDWRVQDGVSLPFETIQRVGGNARFDQVGHITSLDLSHPVPAARFAPPPPPAYDATFPAGRSAVTVPFRLINNHIYLDASIDGAPPAPFVFDTGATNVLDTGYARSRGLAIAGALPGGGFGNAIASSGFTSVRSVSIGGLALSHQVFSTFDDTGWSRVEGVRSAGLLGYEFAQRTVVRIDYADRRITFTRPDAFRPPPGVTPIPFVFDAHIPVVEGSLDGIAGQFEIDTGSRASLILMHPFVVAHGLIARYHATRMVTIGYGLGGPARALLARGGELTLGPVRLARPVVEMEADGGGASAATHTAGNVGGDLLRRFTVTLDYDRHLIWLQPNRLSGEPERFDRSGMWIVRAADGAIAIADISGGGAAQAAGLAAGDRILSVGGHPAATTDLAGLRALFRREDVRTVALVVRGPDGRQRQVTLRLQNQV